MAECEARSRQEAIEDGLLEEAKTNAERNLRDIFYVALGDEYTVNIQWK